MDENTTFLIKHYVSLDYIFMHILSGVYLKFTFKIN